MTNSSNQQGRPTNPLILPAIIAAGGAKAASKVLDITPQAIYKWAGAGIPRTEWTGETTYLQKVEQLQLNHSGRVVYSAAEIKGAQKSSQKN